MKRLFAFAVLLTGCATAPKPKAPEVLVIKPIPRVAPAVSMQPCPALGALEGDSFGDVVRKLAFIAEAYKACEARRRELQEFISTGPDSTSSRVDPSTDKR